MDVVQQILGMPTDPNKGVGAMKGEILVKPVKIISIRRAPGGAAADHAATPRSSRIGVDVPWVTSWSGEKPTRVSRCPSVDGLPAAGQADKPGEGEPLYSSNHLFRQRSSVREMLCPMCGKPTEAATAGPRPAAGPPPAPSASWAWATGCRPTSRTTAPCSTPAPSRPLHRACAERALTDCPHLEGMPDHELKPFPGAWIVVPLTIEAKPPPALGGAQQSVAVISFLQLIGVPEQTG